MSITRAEFLRLYDKQQDVGKKYATLVANTLIGEPSDANKMQAYFQQWLQLEKDMQKNISDPTPPSGGRRRQTCRKATYRKATYRKATRRALVTRRALAVMRRYSSSE